MHSGDDMQRLSIVLTSCWCVWLLLFALILLPGARVQSTESTSAMHLMEVEDNALKHDLGVVGSMEERHGLLARARAAHEEAQVLPRRFRLEGSRT